MKQMACPSCSASINYKPEWTGRRGKCLNCGSELTFGSDPAPEPELSFAPAAAERPQTKFRARTGVVPRPARAPVREHTVAERYFIRFGVTMAIVGILAIVLPYFGLQLRIVSRSNVDPSVVGVGLIVVGGLISAFFGGKRYVDPAYVRRLILGLVAGAVALAILFVATVAWYAWRQHREQSRFFEEARRQADEQRAGGMRSLGSRTAAPTLDYRAILEKATNDGEVVAVTVRGCSLANVEKLSNQMVTTTRAVCTRNTDSNGNYVLSFYPVKDAKRVLDALPKDHIVETNEAAKTATLQY